MEKFNYETNGYNRREVNAFIHDVITQTEDIIKKCQLQAKEIEDLKKELDHYRTLEDSLKLTLTNAEKTADDMKKVAGEEASIIVMDAKHNANRIVNEALLKAEKTEVVRENLEKNMKIFKRKLKLVVEQQMAIVDEIEVLELEEP